MLAQEANVKEHSGASTTVLAVLSGVGDQALLRSILDRSDWNLRLVPTFREAQAALHEARPGIVISDCCLPEGRSWRDLLDEIATLPQPPPLIVASRLAENHLWAEVLNLGGYDLLVLPFEATEVLHAVRSAWLSSSRIRR